MPDQGFSSAAREDAATARVRASVTHFVAARARVEEWPALIREARLDALVHLDVGMHPHSQVLAALRLAPLQAVAWGHPVTTGLETIDWFLSGAAMAKKDELPAVSPQGGMQILLGHYQR